MYDESFDVMNAKEVKTPSGSEEEVEAPLNKMSGSKFPAAPARHLPTAHEFNSDSDSNSEPETFINETVDDQSPDTRPSLKRLPSKQGLLPGRTSSGRQGPGDLKREQSKESKRRPLEKPKQVESTDNSDSDSDEYEREGGELRLRAAGGSGRRHVGGVVVPADGAYDPKKFTDLKVSPDVDNLFQNILRYTPQKIEIDFKLQPFIPDYIPAVGDIDAFIKVNTPQRDVKGGELTDDVLEKIDNLGLTVLDEPAAEQSDSALLHLQLRAISKTNSAKSTMVTKKIENAEKNSKQIERWIKDVSELHLSKPAPTVSYTVKMPDLDTLMEEWPESMEETLNNVGFPSSTIDCSLIEYVDMISTMFDIPVTENSLNGRLQSLHVLFTLYAAIKNSQLYADRQKEEKGELNL